MKYLTNILDWIKSQWTWVKANLLLVVTFIISIALGAEKAPVAMEYVQEYFTPTELALSTTPPVAYPCWEGIVYYDSLKTSVKETHVAQVKYWDQVAKKIELTSANYPTDYRVLIIANLDTLKTKNPITGFFKIKE